MMGFPGKVGTNRDYGIHFTSEIKEFHEPELFASGEFNAGYLVCSEFYFHESRALGHSQNTLLRELYISQVPQASLCEG